LSVSYADFSKAASKLVDAPSKRTLEWDVQELTI
jgi:hypothetical protein